MFYLIRHGEANIEELGTKIYKGFGENFNALTTKGIEQIKGTAKDDRLKNITIIISSPYTRALQTAAILSKELQIDMIVESDLHEALADKNYSIVDNIGASNFCNEFTINNGEYPNNEERYWENNTQLKNRLLSVLKKYKEHDNVIVACHGMLIYSVNGHRWVSNGEIVEYNLED